MEIFMLLATIAIAIFTFGQFTLLHRQHEHDRKVQEANYKIALFEKRMSTLQDIEEFMGDFHRSGKPDVEMAVRLRYRARTARFLLTGGPLSFIDDIVEKAIEFDLAKTDNEPLRQRAFAGQHLTSDELRMKNETMETMKGIRRWFLDQYSSQRAFKEFEPYLKLPDAL